MEKFTKWSDKSGVNPFVPSTPKIPKSSYARVLYSALIYTIAIPKLITIFGLFIIYCLATLLLNTFSLLLISLIWNYHTNDNAIFLTKWNNAQYVLLGITALSICSLFNLPIWTPDQLLKKIVYNICCWFSLFLLGVRIECSWGNFRKLGLDNKSFDVNAAAPFRRLYGGDLILCNQTNLLEVLYLASICNPIFAFPYKLYSTSTSTTFQCMEASLPRALWMAAYGTGSKSLTSMKPLSNIIAHARYRGVPVILFVEGTRTNGDAVLEFPIETFYSLISAQNTSPLPPTVHLAGFVYPPPNNYSPAHPVGSPLRRLVWLAGTAAFQLTATYVIPLLCIPSSILPRLPSSDPSDTDQQLTPRSHKALQTWLTSIRDCFAQLIKKTKVNLTVDDSNSFRLYYEELLRDSNSEQAKALSDSRKKL